MKQIFELYINSQLVDFSSDFDLHFNYQLEDLTNPTNIKNTFTKTIKIDGTPNNNRIFNSIYHLDSFITPSEYIFNPMERIPFQLFKNGDLVESGYMQLTSIDVNNKQVSYNINLFGGLGDFFYSLAYTNDDNADNIELRLKDLYFQVEDEHRNILPKNGEFDFKINHQFVYDCFSNPLKDDNTLQSFITFVPTYQGLYEDFDNDKVLVNMRESNVFPYQYMIKYVEEDGTNVEYASYYGHAIVELPNGLTEWEVRDLRSYKQKPALRLSKLFQAICNPINNGGYSVELDPTFFNQSNYAYYKAFIVLPNIQFDDEDETVDKTNRLVTKEMILSTEYTPLQYLLDYCKMFGLYFEKDLHEKKIYIKTRNNYFSNKVIDINDKIDYSKTVNITPHLFTNKYYKLSSKETSTYLTDKYKNNYSIDYGQKRINTNYNFNKEVVDMYEDNIYQNSVPMLQSGRYYFKYFTSDDYQAPSWLIDNPTMTLYKYEWHEDLPLVKIFKDKTTDYNIVANEYLYKPNDETDYIHQWIDKTKTKNLNIDPLLSSYDAFEKICCYTQNNNEQQATDLNNFLVVYNDQANLNYANYIISDDNPFMFELNEKACYYYSEQETEYYKKLLVLPHFSRYSYDSNIIEQSLDFGKPRELYTPYTIYDETTTIYNNYWQNYFLEQFDKNTKKVTCNVNLNDMVINNDSLKHFYYFDNCYWLLNKVDNYSPNNWNTTKCEFIKVNNKEAYTQGQHINFKYFMLSNNSFKIDYKEHDITTKLYSTNRWYIDVYSDNVTDITPFGSGSGVYDFTFKVHENDSYNVRTEYINLYSDDGYSQLVTIQQLPNPETTALIYGDTKYTDGWVRVQTRNSSIVNEVDLNASGKYQIYAPKNSYLLLMVMNEQGEEIYRRTITNLLFEDKIKIDLI